MSSPRILLLGTGNAFHSDGRAAQSVLVAPGGGAPFLVDVGPGTMGQLQRFEVAYSGLDGVFITHLHGDHTAGWPFLLLNLELVEKRTRPLNVYGPAGTRECLEGLARLCYGDLLAPAALGLPVRYHELPVCAGTREDGWPRFDIVPVEHHPTSIGYRFYLGSTTVAVSGDTGRCRGLEGLARDVDILIVECSTLQPQVKAHLSLAEIREGLERWTSRLVVLVHLTDEVAAHLASDPLPGVVAGYDGMVLPLPEET